MYFGGRVAVSLGSTIATRVMQELQVPVDDLHAVFPDAASRGEALAADRDHFTAAGQLGLAKAVAAAVAQHLPAQNKN